MVEQMYTIDSVPVNRFHKKVVFSTLAGYTGTGYILGIIQFAMASIVSYMDIDATWQGLIGATPLIGVFFGAFFFGRLSDKIGRKKILWFSAIATTVFSGLQFFVEGAGMLFLMRLVLGFLIGAEYTIVPAYATEIIPAKLRGTVLTLLNVVWTGGYVGATFVGYACTSFGEEGWRYMLASSAVFGILSIAVRVGMPESPRWLSLNGRFKEAVSVIRTYIGENIAVENLAAKDKAVAISSSYRALFSKNMWKKTMFICVAFVAGVLPLYGLMTFMPAIMATLGIENDEVASLGVNLCLFFGAMVTVFALKLSSRKTVTAWALFISGVPLILLGLFPNMAGGFIVALFGIQIFFACISGGIIAFVFPSETFPTEIRTTGNGFCTAISRIGAALGTFVVPTLINTVGISAVVLVIGVVQFIAMAVTIAWAPKTRDDAVQ